MDRIYIFLAPGYEPLEALAPADVLKRAKLDVRFVATEGGPVPPSTQQYGIVPDLQWGEFLSELKAGVRIAAMIFPGGLPGADFLGANEALMDVLRAHYAEGGLTCAICAAPGRVLAPNIDVEGRRMTMYAGMENELLEAGALYTAAGVEQDGNLITAKGPGLAIEFGLKILENLVDPRVYEVVKKAMML